MVGWGPPVSPLIIGVGDKKRGDNTIKKILGKIFDKLEVLLYLCGVENNKQTAVEWLFERINLFCMFTDGIPDEWLESLEQAKEMEKQQIVKAWDDGDYAYFSSKETGIDFENGEQYYNEEYGGNK